MVSTASTKKPPPRLSTKDYLIRAKALDLLSQATPDHQIVYENNSDDSDDEYSHFSWITPISSYQNSRSISAMERRQKHEPARIAPTQDQWIDIFVPAVSCISNACKEGILSMVKQTTDGFQEIRNDLRERRQYEVNVKEEEEEISPSHQPRYTKDLPQVQGTTSDHRGTQKKRLAAAAGQHTAERHYATTTTTPPVVAAAARQAFSEEDILCYNYNSGEWRPSGSLFVPVEEIRQYQYYDDVSAMTDDGSGATLRSTTTTTKKCLFGFCPVL